MAIFAATFASAQASPPKLEFEVAAIRPSQPSGPDRVDAGLHMDGSQARFGSLNLKEYIAIAYHVPANRVIGPDWIAQKRFNISAKLPDGSTIKDIPQMMQSLLAERFQLKIHRETKELPAYALLLGKPPLKLQAAAPDSALPGAGAGVNVAASGSAAGVSMRLSNGGSFTFANDQFDIKKVSMDVLADQLTRYLDRPVVNKTGLQGNYDMKLAVTPEDYQALLIRSAVNSGIVLPPPALRFLDGGPPDSLFDALKQQGLRLENRKLPLDLIVVDQALEAPTAN
jgi:uncharacterized protein (TIGR03435 family)